MTDTRALLDTVTTGCLQVVGAAWLLAAGYYAVRRSGPWRGRLWHFLRTLAPEPWLLVVLPIVAVLARFVPRVTFWNPVLAAAGATLVVASSALMLWARWVLGRMWAGRPLVQEGHELCTTGPYRLVRHPIYTGIVGLALGGMLVAGFGRMLVVAPCVLAFAAWRVRVEDRMMTRTFGDRYRAYRGRVPALVPGWPVVAAPWLNS